MEYQVFAIRDALVGFGPVVTDVNVQSAVRNFSALSSSPNVAFKDFELYQVGTYLVDDGVLLGLPAPKLIVRGSDILRAKESDLDEAVQSE